MLQQTARTRLAHDVFQTFFENCSILLTCIKHIFNVISIHVISTCIIKKTGTYNMKVIGCKVYDAALRFFAREANAINLEIWLLNKDDIQPIRGLLGETSAMMITLGTLVRPFVYRTYNRKMISGNTKESIAWNYEKNIDENVRNVTWHGMVEFSQFSEASCIHSCCVLICILIVDFYMHHARYVMQCIYHGLWVMIWSRYFVGNLVWKHEINKILNST